MTDNVKERGPDEQGELLEKSKPKTEKPRMWHVILLNDDFTPMVFVIAILVHVFHHATHEAEQIMLEVHQKGKGIAGTYTYEVAETKQLATLEIAKHQQYPLQAVLEPAEPEENE